MYENATMRPVEVVLKRGGGEIKKNNGGSGESNSDIL
jgi:hypothetical protein